MPGHASGCQGTFAMRQHLPPRQVEMAGLNPNMSTRSMFGTQPLSARRSQPSYGFGSATREHTAKLFVSNAHSATVGGKAGPGPATYHQRASVGNQIDGRKASAPSWVMGTGDRFKQDSRSASAAAPGPGTYALAGSFGSQASSSIRTQPAPGFGSAERSHVAKIFVSEEHNKSLFGTQSPGPCSYDIKGCLGKQDASRLGVGASQPTWVFGSTKRFQYDHVKRAAATPGPGTYVVSSSTGRQASSTRHSAPIFGFGSSDRSQQAKLYMSPEHDKMNFGINSPGPCTYNLNGSVGVQRLSKDASSPGWCAPPHPAQDARAPPCHAYATPRPLALPLLLGHAPRALVTIYSPARVAGASARPTAGRRASGRRAISRPARAPTASELLRRRRRRRRVEEEESGGGEWRRRRVEGHPCAAAPARAPLTRRWLGGRSALIACAPWERLPRLCSV